MTRKKENINTENIVHENFPIVAIGASAGGLEAMRELLKNLNPETGFAYVYIQHLDPSHKSMLSEILSRDTLMKVSEAEEHMRIEKNHLYIIPPNKNLSVIDGVLSLDPRDPRPAIHLPINTFFISLAEKHREVTIGIVLSGNAKDGTEGLKAIKNTGGITIAQDQTATFPGMPSSALEEGVVDFVLSPAEMAKELERIAKNAASLTGYSTYGTESSAESINLAQILQFLKKSTGADFIHYKMNTVKRRIIRRMILHKFENLSQYYHYLLGHGEEAKTLNQDLLINVTSFFRDPELLEFFKKNTLPELIQSKNPAGPLRIWVAACSSGEEAYSLAMAILEYSVETKTDVEFQIFGTDLSQNAINKARQGVYAPANVNTLSQTQIDRFFSKSGDGYRIQKFVRDHCVFAPHNLFKDPPFSRLDLVSCCNLFIYLTADLQKKIIATFWYSLNQPGYLILGKSESIGASGQLFFQPDKKYKLFTKKPNTASKVFIDMNYRLPAKEPKISQTIQKEAAKTGIPETTELHTVVDNLIQEHVVPGSVVINQEMEILQFRGSTGLFLEHPRGKATFNLLKLVRPDLTLDLRNIILKATRTGMSAKKSLIPLKIKGSRHLVSIDALPFKLHEENLLLIVFQELPAEIGEAPKELSTKDQVVKKLKEELQVALENMRTIVEDQEASKEELQSANEEILSSNEELQSINEELETSKEEVESTNEELLAINSEMQVRNEQLAESEEYAEAIFETIREAVILLNKDFSVKMANKAFYSIFKTTREATVGHSLFELGNSHWNIESFKDVLNNVLHFNKQIGAFEIDHDFPQLGKKIMLLNIKKIIQKTSRQEMILIAIEDITESRLAQKMTDERENWFRTMADYAPVMIWMTTAENDRTFFNNTWREFTGMERKELNKQEWLSLMHENDRTIYISRFQQGVENRDTFEMEYRLRKHDNSYRWIIERAKPLFTSTNQFSGYIGSCTEIHNKKVYEEELEREVRDRTHELQHINEEFARSNKELEQFAYVASHDLQEPLRKIITFSDRLQTFTQELPEEGHLYLRKIENSTLRMRTLIHDLLTFAITNKNEQFVRTDLNTILQQVMQNLDLLILEKKVSIKSDTLPIIQAVPVQMEQLFHNLLSNALKFSKTTGIPEINISCRELSSNEEEQLDGLDHHLKFFVLTFSDNGIGFNNENAEKIFAIFSRLNERHVYPGTGIGLALCRKIVENHGGKIFATAHMDQGAIFNIILPRKD